MDHDSLNKIAHVLLWGISSVGRAPALHAGGQEFESPILHFTSLSKASELSNSNGILSNSMSNWKPIEQYVKQFSKGHTTILR
jgi:hypothetical protein